MDIKLALENWARWARDRYHKQHCASLEHRYRSPQAWGDWETASPDPIAPPVDILHAVEVQKVIGKLGFSYSWALTFAYCYPRYDRWKAAAFCKVYRPERLVRLVRKAENMVANRLQLQNQEAYKRDVISPRTGANPDSPIRERSASRPGLVFRKAA
jgi:hypothetical protein